MTRRRTNPSGQFTSALDRLAAAYRVELTDDQARVYWDGLDDLEHARLERAIDAAIRTSQWMPKVAELRRITNELPDDSRLRYVDGQPVYSCPVCEDAGTVVVWHPETVDALRAGETAKRMTGVVACTCAAGDRWARERTIGGHRCRPLPRYDEKRMRRPQFTFEAEGELHLAVTGRFGPRESADLDAWILESRRVENHPNYRPEFAVYNEEATA